MLSPLLLWLDGSPDRYLTIAWMAFATTAASALAAKVWEGHPARWNRPWIFAGLLLLTIVAFRWPRLFWNTEIGDPDESQILAAAMTLRRDPWFWRSLDGATHGPFVSLPLMLASFAGWPLDYTGARMMGVLLTWAGLICTWASLKSFYDDGTARLAVLPVFALLAFTRFWGFIQFYGEPITALLLAAAVWLLIAPLPRLRGVRLVAGGACLGAVPFAKLQGVPIGLWIGSWSLGTLLADRNRAWNERWRSAGWLVGGAFLVPMTALLYLCTTGIWSDFWDGYILGNLVYAGDGMFDWADAARAFMEMGRAPENFNSFLVPAAIALTLFLVPFTWLRAEEQHRTVFALGLGGVALYATMAPRRDFPHYLLLLLFPVAYAVGVVWGNSLAAATRDALPFVTARCAKTMSIVIFVGIGLAPQMRWRMPTLEPLLGNYRTSRGALQVGAVGAELRRLSRPGERCAIWGWAPRYYVESRLPQGTRDGATAWAITGQRTSYYRQRFLADLERGTPALFVDAVGKGNWAFTRRATQGHETFPALGEFVMSHYRLVADIEGTRIYLRADLVSDRAAGPTLSVADRRLVHLEHRAPR